MRNIISLALISLFIQQSANGAVISSYSGSSVSVHNCSGVNAEYIEQNQQKIIDFARELNYQNACEQSSYENGAEQERFAKQFDGQSATTSLYDAVYSESELQNTVLSLPEIHMLASSNQGNMSIARSFAVQGFLWTGEDTTLSFDADLDYTISEDQYDEYGNRVVGAYYESVIAASSSITLSTADNDIYPLNFDEGSLLGGQFYSSDNAELAGQARYDEIQLGFRFDVKKDSVFYLFGRATAYGWNGGFVDSLNTLTTTLRITGKTFEESNSILSTSIALLEPTSVPSPSTFLLFILTFIGLVIRTKRLQRNK